VEDGKLTEEELQTAISGTPRLVQRAKSGVKESGGVLQIGADIQSTQRAVRKAEGLTALSDMDNFITSLEKLITKKRNIKQEDITRRLTQPSINNGNVY
jgi:hypothetical protein